MTKDDSVNLFYMAFVPASSAHAHSYYAEETMVVGCTIDGLLTYVCGCGDSYTETIPATGHDFVDGFCTNCGADDPDYNEGGEEIPEDKPEDNPEQTPDNEDETPDDEPISPENPENPDDNQPEVKLNFFQRIWKAIADFFRRLFGKKD